MVALKDYHAGKRSKEIFKQAKIKLTIVTKEVEMYIGIDQKYYRPVEVDFLLGDYSKAKKLLGWEPKVGLETGIAKMVEFEKERMRIDA